MLCVLFCHPFGAGYVVAFTRRFTPGYILSALRACGSTGIRVLKEAG